MPTQLNLVVQDLDATLRFYRLLGWEIDPPEGEPHTAVDFGAVSVAFDQVDFARRWNTGAQIGSGGIVLGLSVAKRADVDELWKRMTGAGYGGQQPPYDTFWGSRYAVLADPDGNPVGLMSPSEDAHRFWPPAQPPRA